MEQEHKMTYWKDSRGYGGGIWDWTVYHVKCSCGQSRRFSLEEDCRDWARVHLNIEVHKQTYKPSWY